MSLILYITSCSELRTLNNGWDNHGNKIGGVVNSMQLKEKELETG